MKWRWDRLAFVAVFGAVAGGINAFLCLARIPESVEGNPDFRWLIVPGGALHGAALAAIPVAIAVAVSRWRSLLRLLTVPVVGWVAGYVSWIPLHRWGMDQSWPESLLWPFGNTDWLAAAFAPFHYFGFVSVIYILLLTFGGLHRGKGPHVAYGVCAGVLGSLWWWSEFKPWYFAVIHGMIWGVLVGLAAHRAVKGHFLGEEPAA